MSKRKKYIGVALYMLVAIGGFAFCFIQAAKLSQHDASLIVRLSILLPLSAVLNACYQAVRLAKRPITN